MSNLRIGRKIKRIRKSRGLTLEELANASQLTKGFLSQLERDKTAPSVATLKQLLDVFGIELHEFFKDLEESEENIFPEGKPVLEESGKGFKIWLLAPHKKYTEIEPQLMEIAPGKSYKSIFEYDEAFGYILEGGGEVTILSEKKKVRPGYCFYLFRDYEYLMEAGKSGLKLLITIY
jgi:transcriptional regulator with XRE-family HTH domain